MAEHIVLLIESIGTPLLVGIILAYYQHINNERYDKMDARAERRKRESMTALELAEANAKLSYACAMALQRGKTNGEVEEGVKAYKKAMKAREDFLKETHADVMSER